MERRAIGHSWSDLIQMARDRDGWKTLGRGLYIGVKCYDDDVERGIEGTSTFSYMMGKVISSR